MWPDWVSNPGPLTYESGALPTALPGRRHVKVNLWFLVSAHCLIISYICTKIHGNNFNGIENTVQTQFHNLTLQRGIILKM